MLVQALSLRNLSNQALFRYPSLWPTMPLFSMSWTLLPLNLITLAPPHPPQITTTTRPTKARRQTPTQGHGHDA